MSLSRLLERIARDWLKDPTTAADDELEQERLRAVAMRFAGTLRSGDPDQAAGASE